MNAVWVAPGVAEQDAAKARRDQRQQQVQEMDLGLAAAVVIFLGNVVCEFVSSPATDNGDKDGSDNLGNDREAKMLEWPAMRGIRTGGWRRGNGSSAHPYASNAGAMPVPPESPAATNALLRILI